MGGVTLLRVQMIWFSKYEFYNKLLGGVTLLKVTLGVIGVTLSNVTPLYNLLLN